ncbi:MAG: hypothetical protein A3F72_00750 [Bacteroidetes bacterium RIFCSPLOWO2_12_FULL_35_15]|nr:MAG: hypothetical protein A3F72_00750 [Bacteroidetes bacterium RIFCSPLOWO2_12_FULL_35_15]
MWNSSIKILILFLLIFLWSFLHSTTVYCTNDTLKEKIKISYDSSKVEIRSVPLQQQNDLLHNADYKYDRVGPEPKTLWERIKEWFWRKVFELFDSKGGALGLQIFEYLLIIAAIVLIILLLLKNNIRALFYGKSASVPIDFKEFEEDIHKINFNELIEEALSKKDFRRAVRLHFLKLLKELSDKNLIAWKIDKTNNDYSIELSNSKYSEHFKDLAILYEYIWYGDFQLDESNFITTISKFKDFKLE